MPAPPSPTVESVLRRSAPRNRQSVQLNKCKDPIQINGRKILPTLNNAMPKAAGAQLAGAPYTLHLFRGGMQQPAGSIIAVDPEAAQER